MCKMSLTFNDLISNTRRTHVKTEPSTTRRFQHVTAVAVEETQEIGRLIAFAAALLASVIKTWLQH